MSNIASGNIVVFPATKRSEDYIRDSRLMSEQNLVGIINHLVDRDAFCITSNPTSGSPFEFNIHGYYFRVDDLDYVTSGMNSSVYAYIDLANTNNGNFKEISGQDEEESGTYYYTGVTFSETAPTEQTDRFSLQILKKVSDSWVVPSESLIKFNNSAVDFTEIDGGVI